MPRSGWHARRLPGQLASPGQHGSLPGRARAEDAAAAAAAADPASWPQLPQHGDSRQPAEGSELQDDSPQRAGVQGPSSQVSNRLRQRPAPPYLRSQERKGRAPDCLQVLAAVPGAAPSLSKLPAQDSGQPRGGSCLRRRPSTGRPAQPESPWRRWASARARACHSARPAGRQLPPSRATAAGAGSPKTPARCVAIAGCRSLSEAPRPGPALPCPVLPGGRSPGARGPPAHLLRPAWTPPRPAPAPRAGGHRRGV